MFILHRCTITAVRKARPEKLYYGVTTCWWTHDPRHLSRRRDDGLPCDPRGGVLLETTNVDEFLQAVEDNPGYYGRHGLAAFMAAHHLNCVVSETNLRPWCSQDWEEYNAALDAQESADGETHRE